MTLQWLMACVHLIALGIGLGSVWARGRALRSTLDEPQLKRALFADNLWGLASLLWLGSGIWRAFGGLEKGSSYYLASHLFHAKMGLFALIFLLELAPMVNLIRWRIGLAKGRKPDLGRARLFGTISYVQGLILVVMVFLATGIARGYG